MFLKMKVRYSIKNDLRDDKIKLNGNAPIYFQVILNSVLIKIPSGKEIHPKYWDWDNSRVIRSFPLASEMNQYFAHKIEAFKRFMLKEEILDRKINRETIKDYFNNRADITFYKFWEEQMKAWEGTKAPSTIVYYRVVLKALRTYRANLNFSDIDVRFVEGFEKYLRIVRKNTNGGILNKHKCLKAMIRAALRKGYVVDNPYIHFSLKSQEGKRLFLTSDEIRKIISLKFTGKNQYLDKVRDTFVFACYSGLRFSDVESLTWSHITKDSICISMQKTSKEVSIALIPQTKAILSKYRPKEKDLNGVKVFPVISNQKTNDYLKLIVGMAGINKQISFHCARHSFATNHISAGTHMLNLRDLLGHNDIKMTEIYAKSVRKDLVASMNKFSHQ